ncbi:MAG: hypothetical protein FWF21_12875 [Micrococcales bacterium]|nr:hypothetical protein [Micrococcales bacterium]
MTDKQEQGIIGQIQSEIVSAAREKRPISRATARTAAGYLSRGLGGELERLADTGRIGDHQRARLESFYSTKGEVGLSSWHDALRAFITADERHQRGQRKPSRHRTEPETSLSPPRHLPPQVNPDATTTAASDRPTCALAYARVDHDEVDHEAEPSKSALRLHMQLLACRQHIRRFLHRCLGGSFADHPSDAAHWSQHHGLRRLLGRLWAARDRRRRQIVIERLDRLLGVVGAAKVVMQAGGQVRAVSGEKLSRKKS